MNTLTLLRPARSAWQLITSALDGLRPLAALAARAYLAQAFFLSGLTKIRDWDITLLLFTEEYKVPLLGDIPFLGALFRSESRERKRTNLMVFLRPIVMRDADAANRLSADRYDQIRGQQQIAQPAPSVVMPINQSPVLPPRPAAPARPDVPASAAPASVATPAPVPAPRP